MMVTALNKISLYWSDLGTRNYSNWILAILGA